MSRIRIGSPTKKLLLVVAFLGFTFPQAALAQDPQGFDFDLADGEQGTVIKGEEHRPDFTVFIDRENLTKAYDLQLKESFLKKISEALNRPPF